MSSPALANICGTDYQMFNPTTNGLDFVTVQSSETLRPCILNTGVFLNYAVNSLTYANGEKPGDKTLGADFSVGMGITDRWDVGINVPAVLSQKISNDNTSAPAFEGSGITEIKVNTKYHFLGDENGGLAGIISLNQNLIQDNPFTGSNPGLTWNFELAADTTFFEKWALGVNFGYRDRNPGTPIEGSPFEPMEDQWIYSVAASYLIASLDTKTIFEIYGSESARRVNANTDRSMNSLEALLGVKHDYSQNLAIHAGLTERIDSARGGAEWRIYSGVNWAIGPICRKPTQVVEAVKPPPEEVKPPTETFKVDVELLFKVNSSHLNKESLAALDDFAERLNKAGYNRVTIEGHTDSIGAESYNMQLSVRRAENVRQYLIEKHNVKAKQIEAIGFGETKPIADNGNYQGRKKNRRVEFKIWR